MASRLTSELDVLAISSTAYRNARAIRKKQAKPHAVSAGTANTENNYTANPPAYLTGF